MRAVVLVGGEGTRLRPLTLTRPKPLLPVAHRSMLERKLAHLAQHGVTEVVLSLGYKPDAFRVAFDSGYAAGVRLHYAVEPTPLDTAGAIRFAVDQAGFLDDGSPVIAVNGDTLTDIDVSAQLAFHRDRGAAATIALTRVEDPSAFGVVPIDPEGRVVTFVEKPKREEAPTDWINAGIYILEPSVFELIAPGERISIERTVFPKLVAVGSLFAVQDPAYWLDAGTPATLIQANLDAVRHGAIAVDPSARVEGVVEESVVGERSYVAIDATVQRSVVMDDVVIESGVEISDSVIGDGARICSGVVLLNNCVVGDRAVVEPGVYDAERLA
jgi:mannose-1-phosphate guanylyltransferase